MAACKLYVRQGSDNTYYGSFPNQEKAKYYFTNYVRVRLQASGITNAIPIYVETGKGRDK